MSDGLKWVYPPSYSPYQNFRHFSINDDIWAMNPKQEQLDLIDLLHTGIVHPPNYGPFIYSNDILAISAFERQLLINISPNELEKFIIDGILMYDRMKKL